MPPDPRTELRALALWHTRRRAVDDLLLPLLEYGPVAVDRVAEHLTQMRALVADEQRAFNAFVEVLADHPQTGAVVLEMFARREETPEFQD
ncbi:MAG: hypothetical protein JWO88_2627 [Frankiales bacterium]|jgi:hypothetical protein|nr:hypothetical protein [Frankiales bacterium]